MAIGKFGTAINCMDGRTQIPVIEWLSNKFCLDYVDMITEPGPDKILSEGDAGLLASIKRRVGISVEKHRSQHVVIVAHDDCAGNPVSKDEHLQQLKKAMNVVKSWGWPVNIYGVWIDSAWRVNEVASIEL